MPIFPLEQRPRLSYHDAPRSFGASRDNGARKHAGCDLYAPLMIPIYSVSDGKVIRGPYLFYGGVFAIDVRHSDGYVVRYGEISGVSGNITEGDEIKEGQLIAFVGHIVGMNISMLHFELFAGGAFEGHLTDLNFPPYFRRPDLMDPTNFLDSCELLKGEET
jgi:murein DD-endopeptidase MepM/ murein hydrolase activator NlpD